MGNDSLRHELGHVLALVQEQMQDLSAMQAKQAKTMVKGVSAEGTVEVTLNAQRSVIRTVIDESYFDDHEVADLGRHVTAAAQAASRAFEQRSTAMLKPMGERRDEIMKIAGEALDVPDLSSTLSQLHALNPLPPESCDEEPDPHDDTTYPKIRS